MKKISHLTFQISNGNREGGFTLVEMLLYMGIFIICLSVFLQLFGMILSAQLESQSTSSVSEDSKYLVARMAYDLSQATNISSPALGATASALLFSESNGSYSYALSGNNLILTTPTGSSQINSSDTTISNVSFTPVGSSSGKFTVEVNMTVKSVAIRPGGLQTQTIQTTLGNR